jgi:CubicO group peptidase (beta-lactamase class C family)
MEELQLLKVGDPREVGMNPSRLGLIDKTVKEGIKQGTFPGAVVLIMKSGIIVKHRSYGLAMAVPTRRKMFPSTIFDLASLTKVVVTVPLALILVELGVWTLKDPIGRFISELKGEWARKITIWHLLTHTSGFPPWAALYSQGRGKEEILELICTNKWPLVSPVCGPGERVIYSDLGYILCGAAIEKATGSRLDSLAAELIFDPLGMRDTLFNPPKDLRDRIAATEDDPRRGGVLVGIVHDENAWAMGGVSGHAGLFSTALDLAIYAQMLLNHGHYGSKMVLSPNSVRLMTSLQTEGMNERRGLGWLIQGKSAVSAGDLLSDKAFGHTGFTGTSLWIDPEDELVIVLLTNRVHPSRKHSVGDIQRLRALVNNLAAGAIEKKQQGKGS